MKLTSGASWDRLRALFTAETNGGGGGRDGCLGTLRAAQTSSDSFEILHRAACPRAGQNPPSWPARDLLEPPAGELTTGGADGELTPHQLTAHRSVRHGLSFLMRAPMPQLVGACERLLADCEVVQQLERGASAETAERLRAVSGHLAGLKTFVVGLVASERQAGPMKALDDRQRITAGVLLLSIFEAQMHLSSDMQKKLFSWPSLMEGCEISLAEMIALAEAKLDSEAASAQVVDAPVANSAEILRLTRHAGKRCAPRVEAAMRALVGSDGCQTLRRAIRQAEVVDEQVRIDAWRGLTSTLDHEELLYRLVEAKSEVALQALAAETLELTGPRGTENCTTRDAVAKLVSIQRELEGCCRLPLYRACPSRSRPAARENGLNHAAALSPRGGRSPGQPKDGAALTTENIDRAIFLEMAETTQRAELLLDGLSRTLRHQQGVSATSLRELSRALAVALEEARGQLGPSTTDDCQLTQQVQFVQSAQAVVDGLLLESDADDLLCGRVRQASRRQLLYRAVACESHRALRCLEDAMARTTEAAMDPPLPSQSGGSPPPQPPAPRRPAPLEVKAQPGAASWPKETVSSQVLAALLRRMHGHQAWLSRSPNVPGAQRSEVGPPEFSRRTRQLVDDTFERGIFLSTMDACLFHYHKDRRQGLLLPTLPSEPELLHYIDRAHAARRSWALAVAAGYGEHRSSLSHGERPTRVINSPDLFLVVTDDASHKIIAFRAQLRSAAQPFSPRCRMSKGAVEYFS